eukprot:COSAG04_NODE_1218_length_7708_cov_1.979629_1_plen_97_part_10
MRWQFKLVRGTSARIGVVHSSYDQNLAYGVGPAAASHYTCIATDTDLAWGYRCRTGELEHNSRPNNDATSFQAGLSTWDGMAAAAEGDTIGLKLDFG